MVPPALSAPKKLQGWTSLAAVRELLPQFDKMLFIGALEALGISEEIVGERVTQLPSEDTIKVHNLTTNNVIMKMMTDHPITGVTTPQVINAYAARYDELLGPPMMQTPHEVAPEAAAATP